MSNWPERFREHALFSTLEEISGLWEGTRVQAEEGSESAAEDHARLGHVLRRLEAVLDRIDPLAVSTNHINSAQTNLQKALQELRNFNSNGNEQHLVQANTHAEGALIQAGIIPRIEEPRDVESLHEAVVSFRRSLGQHLRHFEEEIAGLKQKSEKAHERLSELSGEVQQQKTRTDEALRRFESQFSESENERRRESQQYITKLQEQLTEVEERFLEAQESRQKKATQALDRIEQQAKSRLGEIQADRESLTEEFRSKVAGYLDHLEERKADAEDIVGAIAQTGMAGGYQKVANEEKKAMRIWQVITVVAIIGFVLLMLLVVPSGAGDWIGFTGRTLAALGLAGLAGYAGREAGKHAEKERHNRRLELEIASIGPFLAGIPEEERHMVLREMADRTFGQGTRPLVVDDEAATTNGLIELLRMTIGELMKKVN